jgi:hypothetical protein
MDSTQKLRESLKPGYTPEFSLLACPACGYTYLHHDEIKVFDRRLEDSRTVTETTVSGLRCTVETTDGALNPSSRRDGVAIQFWCEECPARPVLKIAQHKGETHVSWDLDGGWHAE